MSLPDFSTQSELFSTAGLSGQLFAQTDRYRLFAQKVYPVLAALRPRLVDCYCQENGRTAVEPIWLLGVSLLQYLEAIPDRQAVEMLRYHAGWNFALNRQVGDGVFHPTTLSNFRQRLIDHGLSALAFEGVLDGLVQAGLVARKSRQRLDSTQMFGRVSRMSRLDCVRESLRLALQELSEKLTQRPAWWPLLWERYVETQTDYRASLETLARKMTEAGADAQQLLRWLTAHEELTQARPVQLLARVFAEQYEVIAETGLAQAKGKEQLGSGRVQNPHEPEATYAVKGSGEQKKEHVGYKVQVAETAAPAQLAPGEPTRQFIVGIVTHAARESDEDGAGKMEAEQRGMGLEKPPVEYVDGAYISAQKLAEAKAQGRELIGPAQMPANNNEGRFTSQQFEVKIQERQAICPGGHANSQCSRLEEQATGQISYRFEWETATCAHCPLRTQCIKATQKHRTLLVGQYHDFLQERRREQQSPEFQERMKERNAIEGTQSELVRAHGLRRARYRGLAKAKLQNYFAGAACNIKRWLRRTQWEMKKALGLSLNAGMTVQ